MKQRCKKLICLLLAVCLLLAQAAPAVAAEAAAGNAAAAETTAENTAETVAAEQAVGGGNAENSVEVNAEGEENADEQNIDEQNPDAKPVPEKFSGPLTLDYAIEKALSNNGDVLKAANNLEKANLDKEKTDRDAEKFYKAVGKPTEGKIEQTPEYYQVLVYATSMADKQVTVNQQSYDLAVASTTLSVITQYYTIANCGKTEVSTVAAYNNAVNSYNVAKAKYKQGMIAKIDLMNAELQMNNARRTALSARVNTDKAKRTLLADIGLDPTSTFSIATAMEYKPLGTLDTETVVAELIEKSPAVQISKTTYEIAGIQYDWESRYYIDYSYTAKVALSTYTNAENDYNKTLLDYRANAYNMLATLQDAEETYTTAQAALTNVKEAYRIAKLQYQYGLITYNDVQRAESEIYSTETQINGALMQYAILKTALENKLIVAQ